MENGAKMSLSDLIYWYQRKIGAYDKQQWERTIEQKIYCGITYLPMRTAKLKTELIDVDLVRGSSFPKAKSKHGIITITRLAIERILFLPLHGKWWIQQTSLYTYLFFLLLYVLQILNIYMYYFLFPKETESETVSCSEVLIPAIMMLILCTVHSQIVSTNLGPQTSSTYKKQVRRTRLMRPRLSKTRIRRNIRENGDCKSSPETVVNKVLRDGECNSISVKQSPKSKIKLERCETAPNLNHSTNSSINDSINTSGSQSYMDALNIMLDEPESINENGTQQDDGFESLNGNNSSDNDKEESADLITEKNDVKLEKQDLLFPPNSALAEPEFSPLEPIYPGKENDRCNSPDSEKQSIGSSKDEQKECDSEEEGECDDLNKNLIEASTSATEWMGVTTNSDECSYSSEVEESEHQSEINEFIEHPFSWEFEIPSANLICPNSGSPDRVSCTIWNQKEVKKAELSVLDISSAIISRVEAMPENADYFYAGLLLGVLIAFLPCLRRISDHFSIDTVNNTISNLTSVDMSTTMNSETYAEIICKILNISFGTTLLERTIIVISAFERLVLGSLLFFLLAVAERTFKQRLLYAKLFSHLTSSRQARKSELPHFRLNKVRNIKTWLSVRSYLKRRGPQRSVDVIVSSTFILTLVLLSFVSLELIKDLDSLHVRYNVEALLWSFSLGMFILRFMTLGTKINKKYRNLSVLITEQINLYLQIEQKPHKKEELMVANSVLKLAADLIKELESPFKISGLSTNPYLYTITKVVLLSALSGVLSELLGFKLKLHKIKIK